MKPLRELMQDKRVAVGLAGLAVLVVAYRIYTATVRGPSPAPPPLVQEGEPPSSAASPGAEVPAAVPPSQAAGTGPSPAKPGGEIAWSWGRNPFLPQWREPHGAAGGDGLAGSAAGPDLLSGLRGTVVSGKSGIAIFGSRLVPAGGRIGGWTVERVEPYAVTLRSGNEIRAVELFKPPPSGGKGRGGER